MIESLCYFVKCLNYFKVNDVISFATHHRLASRLYKELQQNPSNYPIEAIEKLKHLHKKNTLKMLRFVTELTRISELFKQHDIPMITFKGPVLSLQLYGDINQREPRDLDVFVTKKNIASTNPNHFFAVIM